MTGKSNKTQSEPKQDPQEYFAEREAEYQQNRPKSNKASINWFVIAPTGENVQFTLEGQSWLDLLVDAAGAMEWFKAAGWTPKQVGNPANNVSHATPPAASAPRATGAAAVTPPAPPNFLTEPAYVPDQQQFPAGIQSYNCVLAKIQPLAGNKVKVEFYGNDLKQPINEWPSFKFQGDVIKGADLLGNAGITAKDLVVPQDLPVNWTVYWKQGREYTKRDGTTGYYKDVVEVREA